MSKVYVKIDERERVTGIDGGYSIGNIEAELEDWTLIDEGEGDKYNLCQCHYLEEPVLNEDGVPVYKFENGAVAHRTEEEIAADTPEPPVPGPTMEERMATVEGNVEDLLNGRTE